MVTTLGRGSPEMETADPLAHLHVVDETRPSLAAYDPSVLRTQGPLSIGLWSNQHTGRSPYADPRRATVLRHFDTSTPELLPADAVVPRADIQSSTVIGADGTIYATNFPGWLLALPDSAAPDGLDLIWRFRPPGGTPLHATPALGRDGTVDLGPGRTTSSPRLGPDGTIYMLSGSGQLFAVSATGQTLWSAQAGPAPKGSPSLTPDGIVYQASTDGKLYAISPPPRAGTQGSVR